MFTAEAAVRQLPGSVGLGAAMGGLTVDASSSPAGLPAIRQQMLVLAQFQPADSMDDWSV